MTELKTLAREAMAAKLFADEVKARGDAAKERLLYEMTASGAERVRVADEDGTDLGAVSVGAGRTSATVVDEAAFTAWVAETYPDAIVTTVDPDVRLRLLNAAKKAKAPVDTSTGEVIPGVDITEGAAYVSARPSAEAKERARELLAGSGLLELAAGQ
ncbi:hypothetical protein AB0B28_08275 [Glycomyces sp. NPDC046736]|uniref:hypothetical protein n=1 Tax=Glycomyces sp. NPDC046736 TaxID=3155615 RepID=UPI0033FCD09A